MAGQENVQVLEAEAKGRPFLPSRVGTGRLQQALVGPLHLRHKGGQRMGGKGPD